MRLVVREIPAQVFCGDFLRQFSNAGQHCKDGLAIVVQRFFRATLNSLGCDKQGNHVYAFTYISSFVSMDCYAGQCLLKYSFKLLELCIVQIRKHLPLHFLN